MGELSGGGTLLHAEETGRYSVPRSSVISYDGKNHSAPFIELVHTTIKLCPFCTEKASQQNRQRNIPAAPIRMPTLGSADFLSDPILDEPVAPHSMRRLVPFISR